MTAKNAKFKTLGLNTCPNCEADLYDFTCGNCGAYFGFKALPKKRKEGYNDLPKTKDALPTHYERKRR